MIHVDEDDPVGELEPSFAQRDVVIKRGKNPEDFYELHTEIGRGKFGTVYHCREKETGLELAAKFVGVNRREDRRNVEREVEIMKQLRHPRLIQLYDAIDNGKTMCVILELITGGELFERVISDDFILTEKACTVFMRQICEGIEFVHQQNILHLDMKPENILCLTKSGNRIKIIDFGLARKFDPTKKLQVLFGTPEFVAPEVVNFDQIGFGTDMWSVGVICYVLLSGLSPFMGETDIETMANVTVAKYDFDDEAFNEISDDAKDFIKQLLVKDKLSRMTAQQCVAHSWLQKRAPLVEEKKKEIAKAVSPIIEKQKSPAEELDVAKDNLRLFVERWSEHPNSPYLFDVSTHEITPCMSYNNCNGLERTLSQQSIGGCSPSPCGSISSLVDSMQEHDTNAAWQAEKSSQFESDENSVQFNSLHSLERRASDSSCFVNKKADVCLRSNLAEEIKKLSERLYQLSTMNTDLINNNIGNGVSDQKTKPETKTTSEKVNGFINNTNKNNVNLSNGHSSSKTITTYNSTISNVTNRQKSFTSSTSIESSSSVQHTKNNTNGNITNAYSVNNSTQKDSDFEVNTSKKTNTSTSSKSEHLDNDNECYSNLPWNRPKFKVTNLSRDVPLPPESTKSIFSTEFDKRRERINNFTKANIEKNKESSSRGRHFYKKMDDNGDVKTNANNTKDLLLQLLDQWGESKSPPSNLHTGRHKSISMEWSESDSVASKSMNSLNTFFKKQSSTSTTVKKKQEAISLNGIK